ncbi:hypothetical protein H7U31_02260 [Olsenella uli]|nr:hypothetical protein [Olsenella uli]
MSEKLLRTKEDTNLLKGFVSFVKELGIRGLDANLEDVCAFYASYHNDNWEEDKPYWMALARQEFGCLISGQ